MRQRAAAACVALMVAGLAAPAGAQWLKATRKP